MPRELPDWHLVGRFLKLYDLLVYELAFLMNNKIRIQRAFVRCVALGTFSGADSRERYSRDAAADKQLFRMLAVPALDV